MASFTIYDPKTKVFRALETTSDADLPFDQVLLINILIELRVISECLSNQPTDGAGETQDEVDEIRASIIQEIGSQA